MANSLQEQLLKAGLVTEKQVKQAKSGKKRPPKGKKGRRDEAAVQAQSRAEQARADKAERDRALNEARKAKAERKALRAQIHQIVVQHRLTSDDGEEAYHFADAGKLRTVYVTPAQREQLVNERIAIVRDGKRYELVPPEAAEKIRERDPECVVTLPGADASPAEDDPYADYQVPDDLIW